jgi:hypothetical protein
MATGPLAVRWHDWTLGPIHAGALSTATVELENAGTVSWTREIRLGYHWLDERGNPLVWDGERTDVPLLAPGERAEVRARVRGPIPPGRYGFAFDLVAELRAWFSELGGDELHALVDVGPRDDRAHAELPAWVEPAPGWHARVDGAHAEGYAVVAGAIEWKGGLLHPRPRALAPYEPGAGRNPTFPHPLLCPSVVDGVQLERIPDVAGLPAYAAPVNEPWIYDGRIVVTARSRSGRRSS